MRNPKSYTGPPKLVMAFDIGQAPEICGVTKFPAHELARGDAKVPSLLYYDQDGNFKAAGAEVLAEDITQVAKIQGWMRAEWWKLHLLPNHLASSINPQDDLPSLPSGKSAVDVLADFIRYLFQCAKTYIEDHHLAFTWSIYEDSTEFIFTHPNGWEGFQQQLYRRAIEGAGLIPRTPEGRSRVHMLSEGEASLHFCAPKLLNVEVAYDVPRGVVIIDAGGGTIDLSMFSIKVNPTSCEEIAPAECRLQGSVFVTRRAKAFLQKKLEGWEHSSEEEIAEYTREFDHSTKLVIKTDQEPAYLRVGGRRHNNSKYDIKFGKLGLTGVEATGLFNDSIDAIIDAFEQQVKYATVPITVAFFLGGLSTNDWVWFRLQSYFKARHIDIFRPGNYIDRAVANGAVLSHVDRDNHLVASRVARATYGVVCALSVDDKDEQHRRRRDRWERDPTGDRYVPGYFETKLFKGANVTEEMEFKESFSLTEYDPSRFGIQRVRLVCYRGSLSDPRWLDQDESYFSTLCTIRADLSKAVNDLVRKKASGRFYYQLDYDVIVFFGFTELKAQLAWKTRTGEKRIPATVLFE